MIALALLFIVIIGLLWIIVRLLQNYFAAYSEVVPGCNQNTGKQEDLRIQQSKVSEEIRAEINAVIDHRLMELEQKFPTAQRQEELLEQEPETLTIILKNALHSSLSLLKSEQFETRR